MLRLKCGPLGAPLPVASATAGKATTAPNANAATTNKLFFMHHPLVRPPARVGVGGAGVDPSVPTAKRCARNPHPEATLPLRCGARTWRFLNSRVPAGAGDLTPRTPGRERPPRRRHRAAACV